MYSFNKSILDVISYKVAIQVNMFAVFMECGVVVDVYSSLVVAVKSNGKVE